MHFTALTVFIIHVVINEVDAQSDCGRISLTYVQTEDVVNAKLQFFPNVELTWYRWVHFFRRRKPDFDFLKTIKTNKSKYDYLYKDHVVTIKALQTSDEGFYTIECETQNGYHAFSENKLVITKPYHSVLPKPTSVANVTKENSTTRPTEVMTTESSNVESQSTTSKVRESYTDDMSNSASQITAKSSGAPKDNSESSEKSKVSKSTEDDMSAIVSQFTVEPLASPKHVFDDLDILRPFTDADIETGNAWLDHEILAKISVITGCVLIIIIFILSVAIAVV